MPYVDPRSRGRKHARHALERGTAVSPPPVHPQPQLGMAPHVHLENVGAALRELVDGVLRIGWRRLDRMLVNHPIASRPERERKDRHDRRARSQRERCERRRRGRRTVEEVDVHGVAALDVLIDQQRNALAGVQHAHHSPDRALPIDHGIAGTLPDLLERNVQARVVERASQHTDWLQSQRVRDGMQLPETEVARHEEHALAVRVRGAHALLALELDARQHRLRREGAELQHGEQQAAEMREGRSHDGTLLRGRSRGKRGGDVALGHAPVRPVEGVKRQTQQRPRRSHERPASRERWRPGRGRSGTRGGQRRDDQVFRSVSHGRAAREPRRAAMRRIPVPARCWRSAAQRPPPAFRGRLQPDAPHPSRSSARWTRAARFARRRESLQVAVGEPMMIGKPDRADDVPAGGCEVREKPLRACDASGGEDPAAVRHDDGIARIDSCAAARSCASTRKQVDDAERASDALRRRSRSPP